MRVNKDKDVRRKERLQVAQTSQTNRAAGWVRYGQKWKTGTKRQYFTDNISLYSTTVT